MNEEKKLETTETTETKQENHSPSQNDNHPGGEKIPTPPNPSTKNEVNVKDLTKLNDSLSKRIEVLEKKLEEKTKPEPKQEPKKETYVPTIQKTKPEEKPKVKRVFNGIYTG